MATGFSQGAFRASLTATAATTGGAVLSLANPEGVDIYVKRAILDIGTGSSGAANVDMGIGTGATTSYDTLVDGCSVATAGMFDNFKDAGSNGKGGQLWLAANFLTVTGSATTAGLVGEVILDYIIR